MKTFTTWSHTWGLGWAQLCFGLSCQIAKVTYFINKAMQYYITGKISRKL